VLADLKDIEKDRKGVFVALRLSSDFELHSLDYYLED
jgi:hypothetical protein